MQQPNDENLRRKFDSYYNANENDHLLNVEIKNNPNDKVVQTDLAYVYVNLTEVQKDCGQNGCFWEFLSNRIPVENKEIRLSNGDYIKIPIGTVKNWLNPLVGGKSRRKGRKSRRKFRKSKNRRKKLTKKMV